MYNYTMSNQISSSSTRTLRSRTRISLVRGRLGSDSRAARHRDLLALLGGTVNAEADVAPWLSPQLSCVHVSELATTALWWRAHGVDADWAATWSVIAGLNSSEA